MLPPQKSKTWWKAYQMEAWVVHCWVLTTDNEQGDNAHDFLAQQSCKVANPPSHTPHGSCKLETATAHRMLLWKKLICGWKCPFPVEVYFKN